MTIREVLDLMERAIADGTAEGCDLVTWYHGYAARYPEKAMSLAMLMEDRAVEGTVWADACGALCN